MSLLVPAASAQSTGKTIKFIPEADLRSLDPIWTTAYITRNHGYMVYDTLFALDEHLKPQPQMVDGWTMSDDKLTYTFTLRDGLKFHDGMPVRSADCIASLARWMKRDGLGQAMAESVGEMKAADDKTFSIVLKKPFPLLLEAIGKLSSNVPFIMPERIAKTDANTQITDPTGSGPFKFVKEEWVPGNKAVYVKNTDYVPRAEKPSWAAGGKVVKVDRVEWLYIPDSATAANALGAGEVDWWQQLPPDLVPLLQKNKDITVANVDPLGSIGVMRFNQLQPPFNNEKLRQAVLYVVDQQDMMTALAGDPENWKTCYSVYTCGTPMASEAGADALKGKRDVAKAKELVKESGYNGERIVLLSATDQPIVNSQANVVADELKQIGLNVDLQSMDWGTLITRRASKEPSRQERLEHILHLARRPRHDQSRAQLSAPRQWREGMVRLAHRRQARGAPRAMDGGARPRSAAEARAAAPGRGLHQRAFRAHRPIRHPHRLPQEPKRRADRAGGLPVERGEGVSCQPKREVRVTTSRASRPSLTGGEGRCAHALPSAL